MGNSKIRLVIFVMIFFGVVGAVVAYMAAQQDKELHALSLKETRAAYATKLEKEGPNPARYDNAPPPGAEVVYFDSKGVRLQAWLVKPVIKSKRPAVLYAHGGDALGKGDFEDIQPFIRAGFIVMLPSWRGENGNGGYYEMCYGEVDDAVAALDYLSTLKEVDNKMLFAAGHSIGATTVMLLAESTNKLNKAAACGGYPDMRASGPYPGAPFKSDVKELDVRSPAQFVKDLSCPLMLFYGTRDRSDTNFFHQAEKMASNATTLGKTVIVKEVADGNHFTALPKAISQMITFFTTN